MREGKGISQRTGVHDPQTGDGLQGAEAGKRWADGVGGGGNGDNCNSINNKTQGKKKRIQFRNEIFTDYVKTIFLTSDTKNLLFYKINNSLAEMSNFCYS